MGGIWSDRGSMCKRDTVEGSHYLDIRSMNRSSDFQLGIEGSISWDRDGHETGRIRFSVHQNYLRIAFRYYDHRHAQWQNIKQDVWFDYTPCHLGGERQWLRCPGCKRRVALLYANGPKFLCRHCYRLAYTSQHEGRLDRLFRKKHGLGMRLFERYESGRGVGKKKGMHWSTYERLFRQYKALEARCCRATLESMNMLE